MSHSHLELSPANRQAGLSSIRNLPDDDWDDRWLRIVCPPGLKERLLAYGLFCFTGRATLSPVGLPAHGLALLTGPPGTGKTTLAHGLANQIAKEVVVRGISDRLVFLVVDPHALPSEMLGGSQRATAALFERGIPDVAADGQPVVVLLDEVEALAVNRRTASGSTNPVDVHRATDAVLTGMDRVAEQCPNVMFLGTTNDVGGVDAAFLSRADLTEHLGLPSADAVREILVDTLTELRLDQQPEIEELELIAKKCAERELDARQVRKLVLRALLSGGPDLAAAPHGLRVEHIVAALGT
jgi:AAA+ superfamily predicted ATPase